MYNPLNLDRQIVLVTGAASGIGRATAILLSRLGAKLICVDIDEPKLDETMNRLERGEHAKRVFDLGNLAQIDEWLNVTCSQFGRLNGLVHAAGISCIAPVRTLSIEKYRAVFSINTESALALSRLFSTPQIYAGTNGSIVFISSAMGLVGSSANVGYSLSKAALHGITRSLAIEYAKRKIRVNSIAPGFVKTAMFEKTSQNWEPEQYDHVEALHPLGFGLPEDIAFAVAFLLGATGRWITGSILVVDGGYTAQ